MNATGWKLSTETLLNLLQTAAIVAGLIFGLRELGELRKSRELASTLTLVDLVQNDALNTGIWRLVALPANLPEAEFNRQLGDDLDEVWSFAMTFESLGILVHRGEVNLDLVDEFFGGMVILSWDRLGPYIVAIRQRTGNPQTLEWFQWLAERLQEHREKPGTAPTYVKYRNWKPWIGAIPVTGPSCADRSAWVSVAQV